MSSENKVNDLLVKYSAIEDTTDQLEMIDEIIEELTSAMIPLLTVVEMLSENLTSPTMEKRLNGTSLLAHLMHKYEAGRMSALEVQTFTSFYCDRLKDHHAIQPAVLYAFLGLLSYQRVEEELVLRMLQSIFAEVHVQSLIQSDRRNVFNLFNTILKSHVAVLKKFENDFILGFIQSMEGERDPRNLLVCFENARLLLESLDISLFEEDFFEVLACYFPVEFTPPKNNPFNITKDDLVIALRACLTNSPKFAAYAVPLFVEKMTSDLEEAKMDAVVTFTICLERYDGKDVEPFIHDIWLSIRKDFMLSELSKTSETYYLKFISNLFSCLLKSKCSESLDTLLNLFIKDCKQTLKDPELTIALSCANVIKVICSLSPEIHNKICREVIPIVEHALQRYTSTNQRYHMFFILTQIISIDKIDENNKELIDIMGKVVSYIYDVIKSQVCEPRLYIASLNLAYEIIRHEDVFKNIDEPSILQEHLLDALFERSYDIGILDAYKAIVQLLFNIYKENFLERFIERLEKVKKTNEKVYTQNVVLLECGKDENKLMDNICLYLIRSIKLSDNSHDILSKQVDTLTYILSNKKAVTIYYEILFDLAIILFTVENLSTNVMEQISTGISCTFGMINQNQRDSLITLLRNLISSDVNQTVVEDFFNVKVSISNIQFRKASLIFSKYLLHECELDQLDCDELIKTFIEIEERFGEENYVIKAASSCIGTIVNRLKDSSGICDQLYSYLSSESNHQPVQIATLVNVCKALILNWQHATPKHILLLISYLCDESKGDETVIRIESLFTDLMGDFDKNAQGVAKHENTHVVAKRKNTHVVAKRLYKQRFVQFILPIIFEKYNEEVIGEDVKARLVKVTTIIIKIAPTQLFTNYMDSLLPLFMHSLSSSCAPELIQSVLSTMSTVIVLDQSVVESYITSLVPRLLEICRNDKMDVRILALKCLKVITSYPTYLIAPLQTTVVKNLVRMLDDKKRLVRKEAVACKNSWHLLMVQ